MYLRNIKFYFVKTRPLLTSLGLPTNNSDPFIVFNGFGDKEHATNLISCLRRGDRSSLYSSPGGRRAWQRAAGYWGTWPATGPFLGHTCPPKLRGLSQINFKVSDCHVGLSWSVEQCNTTMVPLLAAAFSRQVLWLGGDVGSKDWSQRWPRLFCPSLLASDACNWPHKQKGCPVRPCQ